jgi:hypothetical protein
VIPVIGDLRLMPRDDVRMVVHHAKWPDFSLGLLGSLSEQVEMQRIVTVIKKTSVHSDCYTGLCDAGCRERLILEGEPWREFSAGMQ